MKDNFIVVVRSSGERTLKTSIKLVKDQGINEVDIHVVNVSPFSEALKESFKAGIKSDKKWTFCIDADVLLRSNSIKTLLEIAEKQKDKVCEIQGLVLDKFFGGPREGGIHLYRTKALYDALKAIPHEGVDIRPESRTLQRMRRNGYKTKQVAYIVGIHDDEQYYQDIYRKCYTQGVKHVDRLELFVKHWREQRSFDRDFDIALKALAHSISSSSEIFINTDLELYKKGFNSLDLPEKDDLDTEGISLKKIDNKVEFWDKPDIYYKYFPIAAGSESLFRNGLNQLKKARKKHSYRHIARMIVKKILKSMH